MTATHTDWQAYSRIKIWVIVERWTRPCRCPPCNASHTIQRFSLKSCFPQIVCIFKRIAKLLLGGTARNFQTFPLGGLERVLEVDGRATLILWLAEDTGWLGGCGRLTNSLPGGIEAQKRLHVWFLVLPAHIFHIRPFHEVDPSSWARAVKIVLGFAKIQQRKTGANKTFNTFRWVSLVST